MPIQTEHQFTVGQIVSYERNMVVKSTGTAIISQVPKTEGSDKFMYVVESEQGWLPDILRQSRFGLDPAKKYLFVEESELTLVP